MQRQRMTVSVTWDLVRWHLQGMYGKIDQGVDAEGVPTMRVSRERVTTWGFQVLIFIF